MALPRSILGRIRHAFNRRRMTAALNQSRGVIHVGANVAWVEPMPSVFAQLQKNVMPFKGQIALNGLVAEKDGREVVFHVSNNDGLSSSILDLAEHKAVWPNVTFINDVPMTTVTLPTLLAKHHVSVHPYDMLVMDTQGSELLVLQGAAEMLPQFRYIKTEAADFEVYRGCALRQTLASFLEPHGFREYAVVPFAWHPGGGRCFDILYRRTA